MSAPAGVSADRPRVFLTRRWPDAVEQALSERYELRRNTHDHPLNPSQLAEGFYWADAVCPTVTDALPATFFASLDRQRIRARMLGNYGVGFNHIDLHAAGDLSLTVTNTPGVLTEATAELAMTLLLMTARRAGEGERELRAGVWQGWRPTHLVGSSISGRTLGIIGMGRIGQAVAQKSQQGFDMDILYYSRSGLPVNSGISARRCQSLEALLGNSDFISVHCPSTPQTRHLLDAERLASCKQGSFLINTARGDVVDEAALAGALKNGPLAGAGIDVYEQEPEVHPDLLACSNAVLLPHLGSATKDAREAMGLCVLRNLDAFFSGHAPPDRL